MILNKESKFDFRGKVDDNVWRFLLTGGVALDNPHPNPAPEWLTDKAWSEIVRASNLPNLKGFRERKYYVLCKIHMSIKIYMNNQELNFIITQLI